MTGLADSLVVEADGGSRGNPGPAGYGALVRDARTGEVLAERKAAIGETTNNVAEYQGLIAGLRAVLDLVAAGSVGQATVEVRMDSKLVVEQMSGRWKVKDARLQKLAIEAQGLVRELAEVTWTWIPRARNAHADRLANEAMDEAARDDRADRGDAVPARTRSLTVPSQPAVPPVRRLSGWMHPSEPPTVTVVARHGATALSVEKRFSGRGDVPLSELGLAQAEALAGRLADAQASPLDVIVSSPLARARQTADAVASSLGLPVEVDEGFVETDFGAWEGLTFGEVSRTSPDALAGWLASDEVAPPGGESLADVHLRVRRAVDGLITRHAGRTVLLVTHVTPIKSLVRHALHAPHEAVFRMHVDLVSLTEVDWHVDGPAVLRRFNDTGHWAPTFGH